MPTGVVAGTRDVTVQPRSSENTPSNTAAISVGSRTIRPCASHAASAEPTATATEKIVRKTVITASVPPILIVTSGGNNDRISAPTSQNQLTTSAPHHNRGSARSCLISEPVETSTLRLIASSGAPSPVFGMYREAIQLNSAVTIIIQAK